MINAFEVIRIIVEYNNILEMYYHDQPKINDYLTSSKSLFTHRTFIAELQYIINLAYKNRKLYLATPDGVEVVTLKELDKVDYTVRITKLSLNLKYSGNKHEYYRLVITNNTLYAVFNDRIKSLLRF